MRFFRESMLGVLLLSALGAAPAAGEQDQPEPELLEYLGLWDQQDEDWAEFVDLVAEINDFPAARSAARNPDDSHMDSELDYE